MAYRDPHTGQFISNQKVREELKRKENVQQRSANRYEPDQDDKPHLDDFDLLDEDLAWSRPDEKSSSITDSMISDLLKRNPDMLAMAEMAVTCIPGLREIIENKEIDVLKQHIATQSPLYVNNRAMIMALYNRFNFRVCSRLVADDILCQ